MIHQDFKKMLDLERGGFTLLELIITCILVGILSSIAIVNLSPTLDKEKLKSTARMIENWINMQRTIAMQHGITCEIQFNEFSNTITSQITQSTPPKPCNPSSNNPSILDINESLHERQKNNFHYLFKRPNQTQASRQVSNFHFGASAKTLILIQAIFWRLHYVTKISRPSAASKLHRQ